MKITDQTLIETLTKLNLDPKVQEGTKQIYGVFQHEGREFPIFLRTLHDGELLQLLTFIPSTVDEDKVIDVARFLHMLNKELDVPGFCIDETSRTVFYRLMLPTLKKEIQAESLEAFLNTSQVVCKSFSTIIEALSVGAVKLEDILKKASEMKTPE
jgi:hypothetical protein